MDAAIAITQPCYAVESWELKAKLASPSMLVRHRDVEVVSVNWEDQDAAVHASRLVVAYKWHGIMYVIKFCNDLIFLIFISRLGQMLGCDKDVHSLAIAHGGMVIEIHSCTDFCFNVIHRHSGTFTISLDGRLAATFGPASYFEVRDLKLGTIRSMVQAASFEAQHKPTKNRPICFAHEGFAVAGAANDHKVHVWDAEHGDELQSLDHGGKHPRFSLKRIINCIIEGSKVHALVVR